MEPRDRKGKESRAIQYAEHVTWNFEPETLNFSKIGNSIPYRIQKCRLACQRSDRNQWR